MRRLLATFLLVCFGIMIPVAAGPIRVCLMDGQIMAGGFSSYGVTAKQKSKCCPDCGDKHEDCCSELKKLPDTTLPSGHTDLPAFVAINVPPAVFQIAIEPFIELRAFHPSVPIRGPDSPSAHRAVLAIWRI